MRPSFTRHCQATTRNGSPTPGRLRRAQRQPGDPQFEVDGVVRDVLETAAPDGQLQQTFMSQAGSSPVNRPSAGVWMPWQWSLYLQYPGAQNETDIAGIQPDGFFLARKATRGQS